MKVAVVGGAGAMGRKLVETLATFEEVSEISVLDRDEERLRSLVTLVGPKVRPITFDVKSDDFSEHLRNVEVVASALGPYTVFGDTVLRESIKAGKNYVDINDDWEPTLDVLKLNEIAREAGVTALIGMGVSPGVSNLLALRAASELDSVDELYTGWVVAGTQTEPGGARPGAAMLHLVHESTGFVQVVENGESVLAPPLKRVPLRYPGRGAIEVRTVGHPEAVTLPRQFPELETCANVMVAPSWWFEQFAAAMAAVDSGSLTVTEAALLIEDGFSRPSDAPKALRTPTVWALAHGQRGGTSMRVAAGLVRWPDGLMAGATCIPAAMAVRMMLRGQISQPGVVTPEEVVPFDLLMEALDSLYVNPSMDLPLVEVAMEEIVQDT
uniref:saccharopine dehydrogenase family protein n=1 Tax=Rhodococcus qingshengii TaxID=334542 RepID=UPI001C4DE217|nr:saccharopine dehydrogenase NADP-binding domain-containing protein [Rhodococcus qingshengii]